MRYGAEMIYALVSCLVVVSLGMLVLVYSAMERTNEVIERVLIDVPQRMERLTKLVLEASADNARSASEAAAQAAVAIARAILTPGTQEAERGATGVVETDAYTTMQYPTTGLQDDITAFFGEKEVPENEAEMLTETERRFDPDAARYDPMADEFTRQMFYGEKAKGG